MPKSRETKQGSRVAGQFHSSFEYVSKVVERLQSLFFRHLGHIQGIYRRYDRWHMQITDGNVQLVCESRKQWIASGLQL